MSAGDEQVTVMFLIAMIGAAIARGCRNAPCARAAAAYGVGLVSGIATHKA